MLYEIYQCLIHRSLVLTVVMETKDNKTKKKKEEKYQYSVKQLPDNIVTDKSYHKVRDEAMIKLIRSLKTQM